ncbi:MAG: MOSC domain-containing protein [Gemmatimonadales bacterium]
MRIVSIQVGQPRSYGVEGAEDPIERPWTSAIEKKPVVGKMWINGEGLSADTQVDRRHHGGADKALLGYSAGHYPSWRSDLDLPDLGFGSFGENLTLDGVNEHTICVGDVFQAGDVRLEVSQPRVPCQTLARHFRVHDMVKRVLERQAFGWYYRVLHEGWLEAGMELTLLGRPYPQWTVKEAERVMRGRKAYPDQAARLADCPKLSEDWHATLSGSTEPALLD